MIHPLLVSFAILATAASCTDGTAGPTDYSALIPTGTIALVQVRSATELADELELFRKSASPDSDPTQAEDLVKAWLSRLDVPVRVKELDLQRPMALAVGLNPRSPEPILTLILPARNPERLAADAQERDANVVARAGKGFAAITTGGDPEFGPGPEDRVTAVPPGAFSARVDLAAVLKVYQPLVEMGLNAFETQLKASNAPPDGSALDPTAMFEPWIEGIRDTVRSADVLDFVLDSRDGAWSLAADLSTKPGSPLHDLGRGGSADWESLAGRLDPSAPIQMLACMDPSAMGWFIGPFERMLKRTSADSQGPDQAQPLLEFLALHQELMLQVDGTMASSAGFGPAGMWSCGFLAASNPERYLSQYSEIIASPEMATFGIEVSGQGAVEIAGLSGSGWHQRVDPNSMQGLFGMPADALAEDAFSGMFLDMFGTRDWVPHAVLRGSDGVLILQGGNDTQRAARATRMDRGGPASPVSATWTDALSGANPGMLIDVDLRGVVSGIREALDEAKGHADADAYFSSLLARLEDGPARFTMHFAVRGSQVGVGLRIERDALAALVRSMTSR